MGIIEYIHRLRRELPASCIVHAVFALLLTQSAHADERRPIVGAIRWDAWFAGSRYEYSLAEPQWQGRLPFYARSGRDGRPSLRADSQEVMDREIGLASAAGIDYWAFCYYSTRHDPALAQFDQGLRRYLASTKKSRMRFCLILEANHLGPVEDWPETVKRLVAFFKDPAYQTVAGGRPLLFLFDPGEMEKWAGSSGAVKALLSDLDRAALAAGLQEPYLAAQGGEPARVSIWAEKFDLDAVSAYTAPETGGDAEYPYSALAAANRRFWEECKALAKQTIPIVNAGWDNRPRRSSPEQAAKLRGPWYLAPEPAELAQHLKSALEWERANPEYTEADAILIYAWNESDEGGWLVPTLSEGDARLKALQTVLRLREQATSPAPDRTPSAAAP